LRACAKRDKDSLTLIRLSESSDKTPPALER
jgi:hypothetical protein